MIPSRRLIILTLPAAGIFLAGAVFQPLSLFGVLYLVVLAAFVLLDALLLPGARDIRVRRRVPDRISLGVETRIEYEVHNASRRKLVVRLAEDLPKGLDVTGPAAAGVFEPGARGTLVCRLAPKARGRHELTRLDVRAVPAPGLLVRQFSIGDRVELKVYPNLVNLRRYDLLLRRGLLQQQGLAQLRQIGQGSEFESLRPMVPLKDLKRVSK